MQSTVKENSITIIRTSIRVVGVLFIDNQEVIQISSSSGLRAYKHPRGCYFSTLFYGLQGIKNNGTSQDWESQYIKSMEVSNYGLVTENFSKCSLRRGWKA